MRANGFYWVKYDGEWEIAKWEKSWRDEYQWALSGNELYKDDDNFDEIDERRIERTDKDVIDVIKGQYLKSERPPDYISNNPYICKPD